MEFSLYSLVEKSGSCEHGTFPCGTDDNFQCIPQHLVCSEVDECHQDYVALCGIFYGHNEMIHSIANKTNFTGAPLDNDTLPCCKFDVEQTKTTFFIDKLFPFVHKSIVNGAKFLCLLWDDTVLWGCESHYFAKLSCRCKLSIWNWIFFNDF